MLLTHVEVVVDGHHWSITAHTLAFDLDNRELAVLGGIPHPNTAEVFRDSVQDVGRPT